MKQHLLRGRAPIPRACFALFALGWLLYALFGFAADAAAAASGRMARRTLDLSALTMYNLASEGDAWQATSNDPQVIWQPAAGQTVRTVTVTAHYSAAPREMCLYYTADAAADFSVEQRVFAWQNADGSYTFRLPRTAVAKIRLDPCSAAVRITGLTIRENEPLAAWRYFVPAWRTAAALFLYAGLTACAVRLAADFVRARRARASGAG